MSVCQSEMFNLETVQLNLYKYCMDTQIVWIRILYGYSDCMDKQIVWMH